VTDLAPAARTSPTPAELRAELEELIVTDLLGPSDPHERLPGVRSPVREWYLVGLLAPKGTIVDPSRGDGDDLQDEDEGGAPGPDDRPSKVVLFPLPDGAPAAPSPQYAAASVQKRRRLPPIVIVYALRVSQVTRLTAHPRCHAARTPSTAHYSRHAPPHAAACPRRASA